MPTDEEWEDWRTNQIAQRRTDKYLTDDPRIRTRPLRASFDRLGATAAMWALIEGRLAGLGVAIDRAGLEGNVCETYPAAALAGWRARLRAKHSWGMLQALFPALTADDRHLPALANQDVCNAVACALVARARVLKLTLTPRDEGERAAARREGWIHVSCEPFDRLLPLDPAQRQRASARNGLTLGTLAGPNYGSIPARTQTRHPVSAQLDYDRHMQSDPRSA